MVHIKKLVKLLVVTFFCQNLELYGSNQTINTKLQIKKTLLDQSPRKTYISIKNNLFNDLSIFYSKENFNKIFFGLTISSTLANSPIDQKFQTHYQDHYRNKTTDQVSNIARQFGERYFSLIFLTSFSVSLFNSSDSQGINLFNWSEACLRNLLVGGPTLLLFQSILGPSRPNTQKPYSHWRPFQVNNQKVGASGHSYMGAVPFLSLARLSKSKLMKISFTVLSGFTALSRIHDNKHYLSQAWLGWWLAYLASNVQDLNKQNSSISFSIDPESKSLLGSYQVFF